MKFIKTDDIELIDKLKNMNYQLVHIEQNNMYVFLNDPPYNNNFSNKENFSFTNELNF